MRSLSCANLLVQPATPLHNQVCQFPSSSMTGFEDDLTRKNKRRWQNKPFRQSPMPSLPSAHYSQKLSTNAHLNDKSCHTSTSFPIGPHWSNGKWTQNLHFSFLQVVGAPWPPSASV